MFKVGDRVRAKWGNLPEATVTEITEKGFKWKFDSPFCSPFCSHPRLGMIYTEGECFVPEMYELVVKYE